MSAATCFLAGKRSSASADCHSSTVDGCGKRPSPLQDLDIHIQYPESPLRSLSGGQRQSVAIGRAIHWKARVLIMDEPTAALGVPEQRKVMEIIEKLKESGVGVIFISHNLNDIFQVSDRILVLRRGEKVGERLISQTDHDEVVRLMVAG
jgi:ABC-type sugar transport system ATPase subunit